MFGMSLFSRSKKSAKARRPNSYHPCVDLLESRDCPAQITLNSQVLPGHIVELSGTVTDGPVAGVNVTFSGMVMGSTTTDSNGAFTYRTSGALLGPVMAVGVNQDQETTNMAETTITVAPPSLTISASFDSTHKVTVTGTLTDIDAAGQTITITGLGMGTVVTDQDGKFSVTVDAMSYTGMVAALETDAWGQSTMPVVMLTSDAPVISDFLASNEYGNIWTFEGHVTGVYVEGMTVRFSGLSSLAGQTTEVEADGTFSFTRTLSVRETGTAVAITTDWWGQNSEEAWTPVF